MKRQIDPLHHTFFKSRLSSYKSPLPRQNLLFNVRSYHSGEMRISPEKSSTNKVLIVRMEEVEYLESKFQISPYIITDPYLQVRLETSPNELLVGQKPRPSGYFEDTEEHRKLLADGNFQEEQPRLILLFHTSLRQTLE